MAKQKSKKKTGSFRKKLLVVLILLLIGIGYYVYTHPTETKREIADAVARAETAVNKAIPTRPAEPVKAQSQTESATDQGTTPAEEHQAIESKHDNLSKQGAADAVTRTETASDKAIPSRPTEPAGVQSPSESAPRQKTASPAKQKAVKSKYDNLLLGIPGKADTVIDRPGYALGYIEQHEQAAWVVYHMTKEEVLTKAAKRTDNFVEDPEIPTGSARLADYRKSGYDRGHLAPAADMAFSARTMADSFYMSNMSPQKPAFNQGIWKDLEEQVRQFAITEKDIYVVTGPILPKTKTITIGNSRVTVPKYYYKVVYDRTPPEKMIGFILPNEGSSRSLREFSVTVDSVEKVTGLDFFSAVPQPKQEQLESAISVKDWKWQK